MPGQLNLSNPHVPKQQSLPRFNFYNETKIPNTHLPINFSSSLNKNLNPPPVIAPHHLVNSQFPVIPPSIAPHVSNLKKPPRNRVCSPQAYPSSCPNAPKFPLNRKPDLNLWRLPRYKPPNSNPVSNNATVLLNFQLILPQSTTNSAISQANSQSTAAQIVNSNHAANSINQLNTFSN